MLRDWKCEMGSTYAKYTDCVCVCMLTNGKTMARRKYFLPRAYTHKSKNKIHRNRYDATKYANTPTTVDCTWRDFASLIRGQIYLRVPLDTKLLEKHRTFCRSISRTNRTSLLVPRGESIQDDWKMTGEWFETERMEINAKKYISMSAIFF